MVSLSWSQIRQDQTRHPALSLQYSTRTGIRKRQKEEEDKSKSKSKTRQDKGKKVEEIKTRRQLEYTRYSTLAVSISITIQLRDTHHCRGH